MLTSYQPELMTGITNSIGTEIQVSYDRLNSGDLYNNIPFYQKGSTSVWPNQDVAGAVYATSQVQLTGAGLSRSWNYTYAGLVRNVDGYGMLGFNSVSVADNNTKIITTKQYTNRYPLNGLPSSVTAETNYGQGTYVTLRTTTYDWEDNPTDGNCPNANGNVGDIVCLESVTATGMDLNGSSAWPTVKTTLSYDIYGSVLTQDATYSASGGTALTSNITNQYELETNVDFLDKASIDNDIPGEPDIVRTYKFTPTAIGQVQEAQDEPGTNVELRISYGYDGWGNASSISYFDPNSGSNGNISPTRTWQYSYTDSVSGDIQGQFPYQITNAMNYLVSGEYAPATGAMAGFTDLNGNTTTAIIDSFGRPQSVTRPDKTEAAVGYFFCTDSDVPYSCTAFPNVKNAAYEIVATPQNYTTGNQDGPQTVAFYDALGRRVAQLSEGDQQEQESGQGCWSEVDYGYDSVGYPNYVTRPYYNGYGPTGSACTEDGSVASITYSNDILGRPQTATWSANGRVDFYAYDGLQTSVTTDGQSGGMNETTTTTRNAMGWVMNVQDAHGGNLNYAYDAFGNPVQVTTPGNAVIANSFDLRGRKTSSTDPDMGTNGASWAYTFDAFNELTQQISPNEGAKGLSTNLQYDTLGRLVTRSEPDMTSTWCYDGNAPGCGNAVSNAIGLVTFAGCTGTVCTGGGYSRSYTYDSLSRPQSVSISTADGSCSSCTSTITKYDSNGQLGGVSTFSGLSIRYQYDSTYGYLTSISQNGGNVWAMTALDASLRPESESMANGTATIQRTFDPATENVSTVYASGNNQPGSLANLAYSWDHMGNLFSRADTLNGFTEYFCYDSLNRLTGSDVGGDDSCADGNYKAITYDDGSPRDGNITGKSDIGVYHYDGNGTNGAGPHAVTRIITDTGQTNGCTLSRCTVDGMSDPYFNYDDDGNMVCITTKAAGCDALAGRTYQWTSFDMVSGIGAGSPTTTLGYTPEHRRGSLAGGGTTTYYLDNPAAADMEEMVAGSPATWHTYVRAYGRIVAEFFTSGGTTTPYYFVGDHLASTVALAGAGGAQTEGDAYDAWGRRRNVDGSDESTGCALDPHPASATDRGFTGQEEMDAFCLVNLNARLYDPALGRMLSADPVVSDPLNGQAFDRYSYVTNRPLSFTDPSGYASSCGGNDMSGCGHLPLCNANCAWGAGGACLDCNQPFYQGYDAMAFFLPMGGLEGMGSTGFGSFGAGVSESAGGAFLVNSSSITSSQTDLSNSSPIGTGDDGMPLFGPSDVTGMLFYSGISYPTYLGELPTWDGATEAANGEWYGATSTFVGGVGVLSDVGRYSAGASTLGINLHNIFNSKIYLNGWGGNQYVWATGIVDAAESLGDVSLFAGALLDGYGWFTDQVSPAQLSVDLAVDAIGYFGGLPGAAFAGTYYGLQTFYPGGAAGVLDEYGNLIEENQAIDPSLVPFEFGRISFHPKKSPGSLPSFAHRKKKHGRELIDPYDLPADSIAI